MGGSVGDGKPQAWTTSSLYLFNIIVGTGALSLPNIFAHAGLGLSTLFLIVTAILSFIVTTWLVESLALITALDQLKDDPACVAPNFSLNWMDQCGGMALRILPRWGKIMWFATIIIYMYGDLSVYTVFVPSAFDTVINAGSSVYYIALTIMLLTITPLTFFAFRTTKWMQVTTTITRHTTFWVMIIAAVWRDAHTTERAHSVKYFNMSAMPLLFGGATYSLICQHYVPQITSVVRNKANVPKIFYAVFGVVVAYYLLMCWTAVYGFSDQLPTTCTTHSVCILQPIYTFTFKYLSPSWIGTLVVLFPLLGILTSFPLIAITLRDNMIILLRILLERKRTSRHDASAQQAITPEDAMLVRTPEMDKSRTMSLGPNDDDDRLTSLASDGGHALRDNLLSQPATSATTHVPLSVRVPLALVACVPPFLVGYVTKNIDLVVRVTGSYGGAIIMFVMPVVFIWYSRAAARRFSSSPHAINSIGTRGAWMATNPHTSPFQHPAWYAAALMWAAAAVTINTYSFIAD